MKGVFDTVRCTKWMHAIKAMCVGSIQLCTSISWVSMRYFVYPIVRLYDNDALTFSSVSHDKIFTRY